MSAKMIAALVLIAFFVVLIILNPGHATLNFPLLSAILIPRQLFLALFFVGGLVTGVLLLSK